MKQIICYFCGEPITNMSGNDDDSLNNHHVSYEPEVLVPTHKACHMEYHFEDRRKHRKPKTETIPMTSKLITITDEHQKWVVDRCLNFSMWVRKKLDEEMKTKVI